MIRCGYTAPDPHAHLLDVDAAVWTTSDVAAFMTAIEGEHVIDAIPVHYLSQASAAARCTVPCGLHSPIYRARVHARVEALKGGQHSFGSEVAVAGQCRVSVVWVADDRQEGDLRGVEQGEALLGGVQSQQRAGAVGVGVHLELGDSCCVYVDTEQRRQGQAGEEQDECRSD